ncbi:MAG: type III secretion system cytoplasmic ring protein SctQ [Myxococcaceae bacterium]
MSPPPPRAPTADRTQLISADELMNRTKNPQAAPGAPLSRDDRPWRPYKFSGLSKVSRTEAMLVDRIEWLMPSAFLTGSSIGLRSRIKEVLEADLSFMADHIDVVKPKDLKRIIAAPTFLGILAPAPHKSRGLLEVELGLAHATVDSMLGGAGEATALRPLTDIEEGVLSYLVLEVLKTLAPNMEPGLPKLRLEGVARSVDDAIAQFGDEPLVMVVQFKALLGQQSGFIRLFIPGTVIGMTNPPQDGPERRARRRNQTRQNLARLKGVKTYLRAEIGVAEISTSDLATVNRGDVVLIDEVTARPDRQEGGTARLKIGRGRVGRIDAEILLEDGQYKAKVDAIHLGDEPRQTAPTDSDEDNASAAPPDEVDGPAEDAADGPDESTNPVGQRTSEVEAFVEENADQAEGGDLLNDIPLQIAVELSRVPITAEEVVALKIGQVLDLNRVPGEPVELSVNGKIVARGELVEVEGHLGVRILSLAG